MQEKAPVIHGVSGINLPYRLYFLMRFMFPPQEVRYLTLPRVPTAVDLPMLCIPMWIILCWLSMGRHSSALSSQLETGQSVEIQYYSTHHTPISLA